MKPINLTTEILKGIRDEGRKTNERIEQTNERIEQTNSNLESLSDHVDQMRDELSRRIVESEIRTSTAITDLASNVRELVSILKQTNDLRPRVEQCEDDIKSIKRQLG
jgi:methyl-accepting chemotaxis protein